MSELPYKRRLRDHRRSITTTLTHQGYRVTPCDSTFHLFAERGQSLRKIRICFTYPDKGDIVSVGLEPSPYRCRREVWYVDEDGHVALTLTIRGILPPLKME